MFERLQKSIAALHQKLYSVLIVYYWLLLFFHRQEDEIEKYSGYYFLLILPLLAYIALNAWHAIPAPHRRHSAWLWAFLVPVAIVSLARADIATLYNAVLLALPLLIVMNTGAGVNLRFLNTLFLLSLPLCVITYYAGINLYGFWPGQSAISAEQNLEWRVAIFPQLPESAFFCLLIFLANFFNNPGRSRFLFYALTLYFVILSGVRTSIIALAFSLFFAVISAIVDLRWKAFYHALFVLLIGAFILLVNLDVIITTFSIDNAFINQYVFRSQVGVDPEEFAKTAYRGWLWIQHLTVFAQHPLTGIGTFELDKIIDRPLIEGHPGTGSESFLTGWLARVGLMFLPVIYFFFRLYADAISQRNRFLYSFCLTWAIFSLGYGSFMVPYHFLFLLALGVFNLQSHSAAAATHEEQAGEWSPLRPSPAT